MSKILDRPFTSEEKRRVLDMLLPGKPDGPGQGPAEAAAQGKGFPQLGKAAA